MKPCLQRLPIFGATVLAIALCACTAEPPPAKAEIVSPALQSTLLEMTALGTRGSREQSYAYTLANNCNLHASKFFNGHPIKQMVFPLSNTEFGRYDYASGLGYAVRTVNQSGGIDNVVFEADSLDLIHSMLQLLEKIKAECIGASASGNHGKPTN